MTNAQPATPIRVIYAKLTSTGDYDVVARTSNIELNAARSLAEKLLLGNVPHEATVDEELAYLRPPEGGHVVIRYTTYNWKDENRGDAFMTDVLWLNDTDFARARNNPFAVYPRTDDVFDVLAELPPIVIARRTEDEEAADLEQLAGEGAALVPLAAAALGVQPLLAIEKAPVRRRLELFTLLLPPSLRPLLTWQTRAFRVPAHVPRITIADAMHANLQNGKWAGVLPDVSMDVPLGLVTQLVQEASSPAALIAGQRTYESSGRRTDNLRDEVARLMSFVTLAHALDTRDFAKAFELATTGGVDSTARVAAVLERASDEDVRAALVRSIGRGAAGDALVHTLLTAVRSTAADSSSALHRSAAQEFIRVGRMPREDVAILLASALAGSNATDALVLFVGLDRRIAAAIPDAGLSSSPAGQWLVALAAATRNARDLNAGRALLDATGRLAPEVSDPLAAARLCTICREVLDATLDRASLSRANISAMMALQDAGTELVDRGSSLADCIPAMFAPHQLASFDGVAAKTAAARLSDTRSPDSQALLAASLLHRASLQRDPGLNDAMFGAARGALEALPAPMRENVRRTLDEAQVRTEDLVAIQGGSDVLPLLGRSAEQATSTRDLLQSVRDLADSDEAVGRLAMAVLVARGSHLTVSRTHQAFAPLRAALGDAVTRRRTSGRESAVIEVGLDLLAAVLDAEAFAEIESAALGTGGMTVRLRRLDRAVALCRAAEEEALYERLAVAIESPDTVISEASRQRLRDALGTGGVQRRLIQMLTGVVERGT